MGAVADAIDVLVVEDFKMEIQTDHFCPIEDILDMDHINNFLQKEYGLHVIGKKQFKKLSMMLHPIGKLLNYHKIVENCILNCILYGNP